MDYKIDFCFIIYDPYIYYVCISAYVRRIPTVGGGKREDITTHVHFVPYKSICSQYLSNTCVLSQGKGG